MAKAPTKFSSLQEATVAIMQSDFGGVLEYRIIYNHVNRDTGAEDYWTVKRKLITANTCGQTHWAFL